MHSAYNDFFVNNLYQESTNLRIQVWKTAHIYALKRPFVFDWRRTTMKALGCSPIVIILVMVMSKHFYIANIFDVL